jgi:hypothetical protein
MCVVRRCLVSMHKINSKFGYTDNAQYGRYEYIGICSIKTMPSVVCRVCRFYCTATCKNMQGGLHTFLHIKVCTLQSLLCHKPSFFIDSYFSL